MPDSVITFGQELNASVQVGDMVYRCTTSPVSDFDNADDVSVTQVGLITAVDFEAKSISVDKADSVTLVDTDFIFFSKDNRVNNSGLIGYYGLVRFENNDSDAKGDDKPEMFATSCDVFESSK